MSYITEYLNSQLHSIDDFPKIDEITEKVDAGLVNLGDKIVQIESSIDNTRSELDREGTDLKEDASRLETTQSEVRRAVRNQQLLLSEFGILSHLKSLEERLVNLQTAREYFQVLCEIHSLKSSAEQQITGDVAAGISQYRQLALLATKLETWDAQNGSSLSNLRLYLRGLLQEEPKALSQIIESKFELILTNLEWPMNKDTSRYHNDEFFLRFKQLIDFQSIMDQVDTKDIADPLLPLTVLIYPLDQRIRYHFESSRETNRADKPEWFFEYILNLIEENVQFVSVAISLALSKCGLGDRLPLHEFISALLPSVERKIARLFSQLSEDPPLLYHLVSETSKFDQILRNQYLYCPYNSKLWCGVIEDVLGIDNNFNHWFEVERNFGVSRLQDIMGSEDAWQIDFESADINETKVTKSALRVKDLLGTLLRQFKNFTKLQYKSQFVKDIYIPILQGFLDRLSETAEALDAMNSRMLRAVSGARMGEKPISGSTGLERLLRLYCSGKGIENLIRDNNDDVFFTMLDKQNMDQQRGAIANSLSDTLDSPEGFLDEILQEYESFDEKIETMIIKFLRKETQASLKSFSLSTNWTKAEYPPDVHIFQLEGPMNLLNNLLLMVSRSLGEEPMLKIYRGLAQEIQDYLWNYVVLANQFSIAGAKIFENDLQYIQTLFGPDANRFFGMLHDCCIILTLNSLTESDDGRPSFKQVQESFKNQRAAQSMLERLETCSITVNQADHLLNRRVANPGQG